jgi:signal transduction histidine kinase/FixJ family two-component response regulator
MVGNEETVILVIDDDVSARLLTAKLLTNKQYQVLSAASGEEGINTLRDKEVDIVLLDQLMPTMDGLETFERIKKDISDPPPVIMATGHGSMELAVAFMRRGGADFVNKSLDMEVLDVKLQKALRQAEEQKRANMARQAIYRCTLSNYEKMEEMVAQFLPALAEIISMKVVVLGRIEGGNYIVDFCSDETGTLKSGMIFPLAKTYCRLVAETKGPVFIGDISKSSEWSNIDHQIMKGVLSYAAFPLFVRNELYGSLSVSSDSTHIFDDATIELIQLFAQRISQEIELEQMQKEIEEQQKALLEARTLSSMSRMTASIAHEMRQPLTAADVDLAMLEKSSEYGEGLHQVPSARSKIAQALHIIRTMMKVYRNPNRENPTRIDINNELENAIALFGHKTNGVEINYDFKDKPWVLTSGNLSRIFVNIIGNALDVLKNSGRLKLANSVVEDNVLVTIEDSGPGIAPEVLDKIFHPEFTTKKSGEGTGLGLWIARQEAEKLGGKISAESKVGSFTRFTVTIPKNQAPHEEKEASKI